MEPSPRIRIEASVPYQESLRWQLSRNYFRARGTEAFVSGEVPCAMTSNECFAAQNAAVLLAALQAEPPAPDTALCVLELAGGMGGFALHFIEAFAKACLTAGLDYAERLEYWLSDDSLTTLNALAAHPAFAAQLAKGRLKLIKLDVTRLDEARSLDGTPLELKAQSFTGIVANYLFCALPAAMLLYREQGDPDRPLDPQTPWASKLWQLESALYARLDHQGPQALNQATDRHNLAGMLAQTLAQRDPQAAPALAQIQTWLDQHILAADQEAPDSPYPAQLAEGLQALPWSQTQIDEQLNFVPLIEAAPALTELLPALLTGFESASFSYPLTALQTLSGLLPLLRPGGLMLISDKGLHGREALRGERVIPASLHGDSLAQDLNFPLLEHWLRARGLSCHWTADPSAALQTMLIGPALSSSVAQAFETEFMTRNFNLDSQYLFEAATLLLSQQRPEEALFYWLRALRYRPRDAMLRYRLGRTYLALNRPDQALECLEQPHDGHFLTQELDWLRAEAYRQARAYEQAISIYADLLKSDGDARRQAGLHQRLGLCLQALGQGLEAREQLELALSLRPEDSQLQRTLAALSH